MISPYFRFSLQYSMHPGEVHGPRITYIPSFNLIVSGEGKLTTEEGTFDLCPGAHVYMAAGKRHQWTADKRHPFVYRIVFFEWNYAERPGVVFPSDFIVERDAPAVKAYIEETEPEGLVPYMALDAAQTAEWNRLFQPILSNYDVYDMGRFPSSLRIQGHFQLFLDYVLGELMQPKARPDWRVKKFMQAAEEQGEARLPSIEQWTRDMGMSRSYFQHLFKRQTGTTPNAYLQDRRIRGTFRDLIETTDTITAIAERHGFESVHSYAKLFRKLVGVTPGEYRRRNRID